MRKLSLLCLGAVLGHVPDAAGTVELLRLELRAPGRVMHVRDRDLNGDGTAELVAVVQAGTETAPVRKLALWSPTPQGFSKEPGQVLTLPADGAVVDACDVTSAPGQEVVVLSERGILVFERDGAGSYAPTPRLLMELPEVMVADTEDVPWMDLCQRPKGGGVEMWLPGMRGVTVVRPGPSGLVAGETLPVRPLARNVAGDEYRGPRARRDFSVLTTLVNPRLSGLDADGDGDDDLFATVEDTVTLFERRDGVLLKEPRWRRTLGLRNTDAAKSNAVMEVQLGDLTGDGLPDVMATRLAGGIIRLQTETRVYQGHGLAAPADQPTAVRKRDGYATPLPPMDLNGDGTLEILEPTVETSPMAVAGMLIKQRIDVDVRILRMDGVKLVAGRGMGLTFGVDTGNMVGTKGGLPLAGQDVDGDGHLDILNLGLGDRVEVWRGTTGDPPFESGPVWSARVPSSLRAWWYVPRPRAPASIVVFFPHVRASQSTVVVFWNSGGLAVDGGRTGR